MKKRIKAIMLAGVAIGMICSCGSSDKTAQESEAIEGACSDLATFQLKGAVKSVTYNDDSYYGNKTFEFSKEGVLQSDSTIKVDRDSLNRIKMMIFPYESQTGVTLDYVVRFKYDKEGKVEAIHDEKQGWKGLAKLNYDEKGFVKVDSTSCPEGLMVTDYTYSSVDDKGNWVKREYVSHHDSKQDSLSQEKGAETRVISYY